MIGMIGGVFQRYFSSSNAEAISGCCCASSRRWSSAAAGRSLETNRLFEVQLFTPPEPQILRVATYNIRQVRRARPARRLEIHNLGLAVEQLDADIVCLREVQDEPQGGAVFRPLAQCAAGRVSRP